MKLVRCCCLLDEIPDLLLPVRGGPGRRLDHGGGLHVSQLFQAPLTRHYPAHLQYTDAADQTLNEASYF